RLGRSLGINNVRAKTCSYSCVYCQLGRTTWMEIERSSFYPPAQIVAAVRAQLAHVTEGVDYLTLVADGEPTLDAHLGETIAQLKPLGVPVAVISNASLIWRADVRADLAGADWVSLKVDAVWERIWRAIDRPHGRLKLNAILDGARTFAAEYGGELATETMLVAGLNDGADHLRGVAAFLAELRPATAYLSIPTRPPAEPEVTAPSEASVTRAHQILSAELPRVELLIGYEGNAFASTGNLAADLLSITAVHPLRREAVEALLARAGDGWGVVEQLVAEGALLETRYEDNLFYVRRFGR
ncbi:MAG: radical SAM protein, partial [Anaerolineae bacterium]|nr:radical SAM protein [Anaerolineae bacterium]